MTHAYGWTPDLPDHRDWVAPLPTFRILPAAVDLRPQDVSPIYDQGALGSCTANAIAAALRFTLHKQALADVDPSRLYVYYKEREMEGTVNSDGGAMIRDGMKVVSNGFVPEALWPYDTTTFSTPPNLAGLDMIAKNDRVVNYQRVERDHGMRACLADGYPFVMGVSVYESFETAISGRIPMPSSGERLLGGHAILCVGYDSKTQEYTFRNSWGTSFGHAGYGSIPFDYLHNGGLSSDFWSVRGEVEA